MDGELVRLWERYQAARREVRSYGLRMINNRDCRPGSFAWWVALNHYADMMENHVTKAGLSKTDVAPPI
jgi:hypothetical protein